MSCARKQTVAQFCAKNAGKYDCPKPKPKPVCCKAMTKTCLACAADVSVAVFCGRTENAGKYGCSKYKAEDYHIKLLSNHYQMAKFPYLRVGSSNVQADA